MVESILKPISIPLLAAFWADDVILDEDIDKRAAPKSNSSSSSSDISGCDEPPPDVDVDDIVAGTLYAIPNKYQ